MRSKQGYVSDDDKSDEESADESNDDIAYELQIPERPAAVSAMMATLGHTIPSKPVVHRGGDPRRARSPVNDTADSSEPARKRAKTTAATVPAATAAAAATVCAPAVGAGPDIAVEDSSEIHALATTLPATSSLTNHPDATMLDDDDAGTSDRPPRRPAMDVIDATMLDDDDAGTSDRPPRRRAMDVIDVSMVDDDCDDDNSSDNELRLPEFIDLTMEEDA
ncbi:uncharacterized protein EHS24_001381 [Apiotrichum porosum]|uniref:Uncharacterized protein n=1 Tax=Apiotrichum porosum TaxID=105984 RepID=A0A427XKC1_9TREE|nr:uncharacterized protein EHS24_001381 [Apiotrichum porosum]RSH79339.1 hypothetical protein EHS24_001381 [Apiotrichum porosum]